MYKGFNVYRLIILLGIGLFFFLFSTLATWYEGAEISCSALCIVASLFQYIKPKVRFLQ